MKVGSGAPGKIRTPDPLIRSQVLYPAELPVPLRPTYLAVCLKALKPVYLVAYLKECLKDFTATWQEVNI